MGISWILACFVSDSLYISTIYSLLAVYSWDGLSLLTYISLHVTPLS